MIDRDRVIMKKIVAYAQEAHGYVDALLLEDFMQDRKTVVAVAFCLGQIGELAKEISLEMQQAKPDIPWKSIRGMRNRVVHDYENVDLNVVWSTVTDSLPKLIVDLSHIINEKM